MRRKRLRPGAWLLGAMVTLGMGCGGSDGSVTCGPGTRLDGETCVVDDGPSGPQVQDLRVPVLYWDADDDDQIEVFHRLPLALEVAAVPQPGLSEDEGNETVPVNVSVFLVRPGEGAPETRRCAVGGDIMLVPRGGEPEYFDTSLTVPAECLQGTTAADLEVMVELTEETDDEGTPGVTRTLHFTAANVMDAARPESACRLDEGEERCNLAVTLEPAAGNENFTHTIRPQSNVGVLWNSAPTGGMAPQVDQLPPNLSLEVVTRGYGNNPNDDADNELPGPLALSVAIAPATGNFARQWAPVPISTRELPQADEPPPVARQWRGNLEDRSYAHLYIPPELQTQMTTGEWAGNDLYYVRVCERPDGWQEDEQSTDVDPRWQRDSEADEDSACRLHMVRFTRPLSATNSNMVTWGWRRQWQKNGDDISGSASVFAEIDARSTGVSAVGGIGSTIRLFDYTVVPFQAFGLAQADLITPANSQLNYNFTLLGNSLTNFSRSLAGEARIRAEAELGSVMREYCRSRKFKIVFVPVEVEGCLRGSGTVTGYVELRGGTTNFPPEFGNGAVWLAAEAGLTPTASLSMTVSGGIGRAPIAGGGVEVNLTVLETSLPFTATISAALAGSPGSGPPAPPAILSQDCWQWARANGQDPNWCHPQNWNSLVARQYRDAVRQAQGQQLLQRQAWASMLRPRAVGRMNLDLTLEYLAGNVGLYGYVGPFRGTYTIASWGGIGGFGGGRSRMNVFNVSTGVFNLY